MELRLNIVYPLNYHNNSNSHFKLNIKYPFNYSVFKEKASYMIKRILYRKKISVKLYYGIITKSIRINYQRYKHIFSRDIKQHTSFQKKIKFQIKNLEKRKKIHKRKKIQQILHFINNKTISRIEKGDNFEKICAQIISLEPDYYKACIYNPSGKQGDDNIDIIGFLNNDKYVLVQCKNYTKDNVGIKDVQRTNSLLTEYKNLEKVIIISNTGFTKNAKEAYKRIEKNKPGKLELWNKNCIEDKIKKYYLNIDIHKYVKEIIAIIDDNLKKLIFRFRYK